MGGQIKRRLAFLGAAGAIAAMAIFSTPLAACEAGTSCATETAGAPVVLKKFSKPQVRTGKRTYAGKSATYRKYRAAARKAKPRKQEIAAAETPASIAFGTKIDQATADAKAEFLYKAERIINEADANRPPESKEASPPPSQPTGANPETAETTKIMEAAEFNDIDRTAWEQSSQPRLMQVAVMESRAEIRADDSKWSQTSMIGKMFVAFGLLLTIGSAIRMFLA